MISSKFSTNVRELNAFLYTETIALQETIWEVKDILREEITVWLIRGKYATMNLIE